MRSDMGKIITERERRGSRNRSAKYGMSLPWMGEDYDYGPKRAKISARGQYGFNHKEFTDVLSPLKRFIEKNVGRPWGKIHSEICQVLDKRKLTHKHVFDHILFWVATSVYQGQDGRFYEVGRRFAAPEFYVHPKNGLLMKNKAESKRDRRGKIKRPRGEAISLPDGRSVKKIDGIWYFLTLKKVEDVTSWDVNYKGEYDSRYVTLYKGVYWIEHKRQLGKKDLKKYKDILDLQRGS